MKRRINWLSFPQVRKLQTLEDWELKYVARSSKYRCLLSAQVRCNDVHVYETPLILNCQSIMNKFGTAMNSTVGSVLQGSYLQCDCRIRA